MAPPQRSAAAAISLGGAATVACALPGFVTGALAVQITEELTFGAVGLGAAIAMNYGAAAVTSPYLGRLADRLGATVSIQLAAGAATVVSLGIAVVGRSWAVVALFLVLAGVSRGLVQPAANRLLIFRVQARRLGTAFGIKQSAPPLASMLAGLSVPAIAVTLGWRWAYVASAAVAVFVLAAAGGHVSQVRSPETARVRAPLRGRSMLVSLMVAFAFAFVAHSSTLAFAVASSVRAGITPGIAGVVFAGASLASIVTRLIAGVVCDRTRVLPLRLCAGLLTLGSLGLVLLGLGRRDTVVVGLVLAVAGTWGYPGVFWFAMVRAYPEAPGRISGALAPSAIGGIAGPVLFGLLVDGFGYSVAWRVTAAFSAAAGALMLLNARRLHAITPQAG